MVTDTPPTVWVADTDVGYKLVFEHGWECHCDPSHVWVTSFPAGIEWVMGWSTLHPPRVEYITDLGGQGTGLGCESHGDRALDRACARDQSLFSLLVIGRNSPHQFRSCVIGNFPPSMLGRLGG